MEPTTRPTTVSDAVLIKQRLEVELTSILNGLRSALRPVVMEDAALAAKYIDWLRDRWRDRQSQIDSTTSGQALSQLGWPSLVSLIAALRLEKETEVAAWYSEALGRVRSIEQVIAWHNELAQQENRRNNHLLNRLLCRTRPVGTLSAVQEDPTPELQRSLATNSVNSSSEVLHGPVGGSKRQAQAEELEFPRKEVASN